MLHSAYKQTFRDDYVEVTTFFIVKDEYLYGINYYEEIRPFYGNVDRVVNGWKLETDDVDYTIKTCPIRGDNYTRVLLDTDKAANEWAKVHNFISNYFEEEEYMDGWFNIESPNIDQNELSVEEFKELI